MPGEPIRTGVVGAGLAATVFHVPLMLGLAQLFTLHAVVERTPPAEVQPRGTIATKFNLQNVKLYHSISDLLADPDVELIVVATPNSTHFTFAKQALEAGKHVLVDKPITTNYEEAKELGDLAKSKNLVLYAFQNRRWDSDYLTLQSLLKKGSLGHITDFESHFDRYRNFLKGSWKETAAPGSGLVYDLGVHIIDQTLHLFGRPAKVTGFLQNTRGIGSEEVEDNFTIILQYDRTDSNPYLLTAILRAHPLSQRTPQLRFLVRGSKGTFSKSGLDTQEEQMKEKGVEAFGKEWFGKEPEGNDGDLETVEKEGDNAPIKSKVPTERGCYQELYKNLGGAIREGQELAVKWSEAALVMLIVDLAVKSSKEGKTFDVPSV